MNEGIFTVALCKHKNILFDMVITYSTCFIAQGCLLLLRYICFCQQVCSDLPVHSLITSVFAKDPDAGENGTVTFSQREGKEC